MAGVTDDGEVTCGYCKKTFRGALLSQVEFELLGFDYRKAVACRCQACGFGICAGCGFRSGFRPEFWSGMGTRTCPRCGATFRPDAILPSPAQQAVIAPDLTPKLEIPKPKLDAATASRAPRLRKGIRHQHGVDARVLEDVFLHPDQTTVCYGDVYLDGDVLHFVCYVMKSPKTDGPLGAPDEYADPEAATKHRRRLWGLSPVDKVARLKGSRTVLRNEVGELKIDEREAFLPTVHGLLVFPDESGMRGPILDGWAEGHEPVRSGVASSAPGYPAPLLLLEALRGERELALPAEADQVDPGSAYAKRFLDALPRNPRTERCTVITSMSRLPEPFRKRLQRQFERAQSRAGRWLALAQWVMLLSILALPAGLGGVLLGLSTDNDSLGVGGICLAVGAGCGLMWSGPRWAAHTAARDDLARFVAGAPGAGTATDGEPEQTDPD